MYPWAHARYDWPVIEYPTKDWLGTVMRVRGTVMPRVLGRTIAVAALTVALILLRENTALRLDMPGTAHAMVGVALGLLLVFRTNASYARFWDGRILLGGIVNNCRDLARQCQNYFPDLSLDARREIAANICGFAAVMVAHLRAEPIADVAEIYVGKERAARLERCSAPPLVLATELSQQFVVEANEGRLHEMRLRTMDACISDLIDLWGGCERILKTPVPFAYAHHIKSFLTIFCFTAPFTMIGDMGWYAPAAAAIVAFGLYGIDEIGVEIEDPFGRDENDLPMDAIVATIERNVFEIMEIAK